jgi:hypothetical protein
VTPLQAELWPLPRINRKLKMGSLPLTLTMWGQWTNWQRPLVCREVCTTESVGLGFTGI